MTDNMDMLTTVTLLMGEPNCFAGMVLLYVFAFLLTVFGCSAGMIIVLAVFRRLLR